LLPLHVRECTLPLCVLAVQCTTLWKRYGRALWNIAEHHGTITERYRSISEVLWSPCGTLRGITGHHGRVIEHYGSITELLQNVTERYGSVVGHGSITELLQKRCGALRKQLPNVTEALQNVTECYRAITKHYRTLSKHYGMFRSHYGTLQSITEHYRVLLDVMEPLLNPYRKYRFCPSLIQF